MPSTWHGVSSLLPVSERFAYRKIPERTKTAGRKSRRGSLGTETIYGEKSGNRRVVDRIRGNAQSHHSRAGIRVAAFVQTSRIRYRRREQARTGSREHESGELATDFKRPGPDRCDHEGRVKVGGRRLCDAARKGLAAARPSNCRSISRLTLRSGRQAACRRNFSERLAACATRTKENSILAASS